MESFKRSSSRDFRIDAKAVESVLNEEGEEEEEEECGGLEGGRGRESDDDSEEVVDAEEGPAPKRLRRL